MKQIFKPNAELDFLTKDELAEVMERVADEARSGWSRPAVTQRTFEAIDLDSNGDSGRPGSSSKPSAVEIYRPPTGYTFEVHRLTVQAEGQVFGAGTTGGFLYILRAGRLVDFAPSGGTSGSSGPPLQFPVVFEYTSNAPEYTANESVDILVSGGPVGVTLVVDLQGTLSAIPGELVRT